MDGPPRTHPGTAVGLLGRTDRTASVAGIPGPGSAVPVSAGRPRPADAVLDPGPARPRDRGTAVGGVPAGDHRIRCRLAHAGARIARRRRRPAILRRAPGSDRPRARARAAHESHLADQRADQPHQPGAGRHPGARRAAGDRHDPIRLRVRRRPGGRAQRQQHHARDRDRGGPEPAAHAGRRPGHSPRRPHRPGRCRRIPAGGPGGHGRADRPPGAFRSGPGRDPRRTAQPGFRLRRPRAGVAGWVTLDPFTMPDGGYAAFHLGFDLIVVAGETLSVKFTADGQLKRLWGRVGDTGLEVAISVTGFAQASISSGTYTYPWKTGFTLPMVLHHAQLGLNNVIALSDDQTTWITSVGWHGDPIQATGSVLLKTSDQ